MESIPANSFISRELDPSKFASFRRQEDSEIRGAVFTCSLVYRTDNTDCAVSAVCIQCARVPVHVLRTSGGEREASNVQRRHHKTDHLYSLLTA